METQYYNVTRVDNRETEEKILTTENCHNGNF